MSIKRKITNFFWRLTGAEKIQKNQTLLQKQMEQLMQQNREVLMASKFHDTICDSEWLHYKTFSPGEWAVDYNFLYTLYRVLDNIHPQHIVEFGLGQSSRMIHQYAHHYHAQALTYEHDAEWIKFFSREVKDKYPVEIAQLDLEEITYKGYKTLTYKGIKEALGDNHFDLIVVDGPFGTAHYSRTQLLELVQNHLADRFCILLDDYERVGEQETIQEVFEILKSKSIDYCFKNYKVSKQHMLICSTDSKFLTSL